MPGKVHHRHTLGKERRSNLRSFIFLKEALLSANQSEVLSFLFISESYKSLFSAFSETDINVIPSLHSHINNNQNLVYSRKEMMF